MDWIVAAVIVSLFAVIFSFKRIKPGSRVYIIRLGKFLHEAKPGLVFLIPFVDIALPIGSLKGLYGTALTKISGINGVALVYGAHVEAFSERDINDGDSIQVVEVVEHRVKVKKVK